MMTFNELKTTIYEIAQAKFGELTPEVKQRLNVELNAIEKYGKTELIAVLWRLFKHFEDNDVCAKLQLYDGYGVSLVCYILGLSLFNPLEHPELITEKYVFNTFRETRGGNFRIDSNKLEIVEEKLKELDYQFEKETYGNSIYFLKVISKDEESSNFTLYYQYRSNACRLQRAYHVLDKHIIDNMPYNDKETFDMINEFDIYGTTICSLAPITLEALRLIRPESLGELSIALAFTSEKQYDDLLEFISNRVSGWNIPTGRKEVDDLLRHTNGILLFTKQKSECLKWLNRSFWEEDTWQTYSSRVKRLLKSGQAVNKCDTYREAYNLYKLAYIKLHYPVEFNKILTINY